MYYHSSPLPIRAACKAILLLYFKISPVGCSRKMGVRLGKNVRIYGGSPNMWGTEPFLITIGSNVYITAGCKFITHDGATLIFRNEHPTLDITAPITIGDDVYIGLQSIILPGVNIGSRVVIGAGSIVTKDIPDNSVACGVPARRIKSVDEYLQRAQVRSLGVGHLPGAEKAQRLKELFRRSI